MLVGLCVFGMQIHGQNVHGNNIFVFPTLFDDTGNWQCCYMGYAWYIPS